MDASNKNTHSTSTTKNEPSSSLSSDSDHSQKSFKKKRKERKITKEFTHDYFSMYTPPWATMNHVYLDLLRHLSLESEIRSSLTQMNKKYENSYLKDFQANNTFEEEQCCDRKKIKHKLYSCEDFEKSCCQLCLSCHQKMKCSSCGQTLLQSKALETAVKEIKPLQHCKCAYDSCPTFLDHQHIPLSYCHYYCKKSMHPCHSLSHNIGCSLNHISDDTPVREMPELQNNTRKTQSSVNSERCYESDYNIDKLSSNNCFSIDNSVAKDFGTKKQPVLQVKNTDANKYDFEDDHRIVPNFLGGGTGDERSKLQVKCTRKSHLPQSTKYFLPISSLSTNI